MRFYDIQCTVCIRDHGMLLPMAPVRSAHVRSLRFGRGRCPALAGFVIVEVMSAEPGRKCLLKCCSVIILGLAGLRVFAVRLLLRSASCTPPTTY